MCEPAHSQAVDSLERLSVAAFGANQFPLCLFFEQLFRTGRVPKHHYLLFHAQMTARKFCLIELLNGGLDQCSPILNSVTCTLSLQWPKS